MWSGQWLRANRAGMSALASLCLILTACSSQGAPGPTASTTPESGQPSSASASVVNFYSVNSATGPTEPYGGRAIKQEQLFVDNLNSGGGFTDSCGNSYTAKLTVFDMGNAPEQAIAGFRKAAEDPTVAAVFGPTSDRGYLPLIPLAGELKLPLIIPSAGSTVDNWNQYAYRIGPDEAALYPAIIKRLKDSVGFDSVALITDQSQNSNVSSAKLIQDTIAPELGFKVTGNEVFSEGDVDFRAQLTKIKSTNPEWLWINGNAISNAQILNQALELGLNTKMYMAHTTNIFPDVWDVTNGKAAGTYSGAGGIVGGNIQPHDPNAVKLYQDKYGEVPTIYAMWGWDAVGVAVDAIKRACSTDRTKLAEAIGSTESYPLAISGTASWKNPPSGDNQTPIAVVIKATGKEQWELVP